MNEAKKYINESVINSVKTYGLDFLIMDFCEYGIINMDTIKECAKHIKAFFVWCGDISDDTPQYFYELAQNATLLISNYRDIDNIEITGLKAHFNNHYNEGLYKPENNPNDRKNDIIFVANNFERFPAAPLRTEIVTKLSAAYGKGFILCGDGWQYPTLPYEWNKGPVSREYAANLYANTKIAISISNYNDVQGYTSDRLLHCLSSGCLTMAKRFKGCEDYFTDGEHLIYFDTFDALKEKIDYYLHPANKEARINIANKGRKQCIQLFGDEAFCSLLKSKLC